MVICDRLIRVMMSRVVHFLAVLALFSSARWAFAQPPALAPGQNSAMASSSAPASQDEAFSGRGVYFFVGRVRAPLAGIGNRGDFHSNRLALDDEHSQVSIERSAGRIRFVNRNSYEHKQLVGDLLFLGTGFTAAGTSAPVGVHLKLEKKGNRFIASAHAHPTVREKMVRAEFEPFSVLVSDGQSETLVLTKEEALKTIAEPSIGLRLASKLIEAWDNLEGVAQDPSQPGYVLVDVSFGLGIGGLSKKLLRIQIVSLLGGNFPLIAKGVLGDMLRQGSWELRLRALSGLDGEHFARDLFLIGIDGLPLLQALSRDGMEKDDMLTIRLRNGHGTVFLGKNGQPLPSAPLVARNYLEFNALGAIIAHQVEVRHFRR